MEAWLEVAVYAATTVFVGLLFVGSWLGRRGYLAIDTLVRHNGRLARVVSGTSRESTIRYLGSDETRRIATRSVERVEPFCCEVHVDGERIRLTGKPEPWHAPDAELVRTVQGWEPYRALYRIGQTYYLVAR